MTDDTFATLAWGAERPLLIGMRPEDLVEKVPTKYYCFIAPKGGGAPRVMEFDNDQEGLDHLANVVRAENVIAVVLGQRADLTVESAVTVGAGADAHTHSMKVL